MVPLTGRSVNLDARGERFDAAGPVAFVTPQVLAALRAGGVPNSGATRRDA